MENESTSQQAEDVVVRLLARREHSQLELQQKLKQRGFDHDTSLKVLEKAKANGWQSDERFAEVWVRSCIARGDGVSKIRAQAPQKGIPPELVEAVLQQEQPNWVELCYQRLVRKFGQRPVADTKQREKIIRHLLQRGFTFAVIKQALQRQSQAELD